VGDFAISIYLFADRNDGMKNIRINKEIRIRLIQLSENGESMDKVVSRILDGIGPSPKVKRKEKTVSLKLSDDTYQKLKSKQGSGETLINVVERAINNVSQE